MSAETYINGTPIKERLTQGVKISAVVLAGLGLSGCGGEVGIRDKDKAEDYAMAMYNKTYDSASPTGKFMLQFLRTTQIDVQQKDGGFFNGGDNKFHRFTIGNGCLQTSAYNVSGGTIKANAAATGFLNGASASVEAELPAAAAFAYVDSDSPNEITIKSGHAKSLDLNFTNVQGPGPLKAVDKQTRDITETTYGCSEGLDIEYEHMDGYYDRSTSPYILHIPIPRDK